MRFNQLLSNPFSLAEAARLVTDWINRRDNIDLKVANSIKQSE